MTQPANSRLTRGGRLYTWDGEEYPSVTTILKAIPKPALTYWAAREAARHAVVMHRSGDLERLLRSGDEQAAVDEIKGAPWGARDKAGEDGSAIHRAIERAILGGQPPTVTPAQAPRYRQFERFCTDHQPTWEASEATVYNRQHGYAGTLDAICVLGGRRLLLDVKTGKGVYPEAALQMAAYSRGEFIGLAGAGGGFGAQEHPMPQIDGAVILHLRPRSYQLLEVDVTDGAYQIFLDTLSMWRHLKRLDGLLLDPIHPPDNDGTKAAEAFRRFGGVAA